MTIDGQIEMYKGFYEAKTNKRRGPGIMIGEDCLVEGWWPQDEKRYLLQRRIQRDGKVSFTTSFIDLTKSKKANV